MLSKLTPLKVIFMVVAFLVFLGLLIIILFLVVSNRKMVAVYNSDSQKCNELKTADLIDDCVLRIVEGSHDQKDCDSVSDAFSKNKCLDVVNSHSLGHLLPCINVDIGLEKDNCVKDIAIKNLEPLFCGLIQSSLIKEFCEIEIRERVQ